VTLLEVEGQLATAAGGAIAIPAPASAPASSGGHPVVAHSPPLLPEHLGDSDFTATHGLRYPYVMGAMANGISSEEIVIAAARAGMLGVFGAAGLDLPRVERAIDSIQSAVGDMPYGFNLIHSPNEPDLEGGVVELYLRRGVRLISASAFLDLTLPLVRYRASGVCRDSAGGIVAPNRIIAKVSRIEVARKMMAPPPAAMLDELVRRGEISTAEAELAAQLPLADDITAEADSGGHTDNQPALALIPTMRALAEQIALEHGYSRPPRIGAAGGLGTPDAVAAAFAMGAAYVLTGSINQACVEAGTSGAVRGLLADARQADVTMAPAADMFEMGVKVQVLKRGTMFALRARKLYELYRACDSLESIPAKDRAMLERDLLRVSCEEAWASTRAFFAERDPSQIELAERDPKHKMALVFRSYLGRSSDWANRGEPTRRVDYQIWCGPAMGAFNEWTRGSFLESAPERTVVVVAMNLLVGAALLCRAGNLRSQLAASRPWLPLPRSALSFRPLMQAELASLLQAEIQVP